MSEQIQAPSWLWIVLLGIAIIGLFPSIHKNSILVLAGIAFVVFIMFMSPTSPISWYPHNEESECGSPTNPCEL